MKKQICRLIFYKWMGWRTEITVKLPHKYVVCMAPHTSNWDFLIGQLFGGAEGLKSRFMMKKEWFFFPLGCLFRAMGGVPVDRSRKTSLTQQMAERIKESDEFVLTITPEGTRKANPDWKKGFYYIALNAGVPIVLMGFDFPTKSVRIGKMLIPSGDIEKDMREVKEYFKHITGKHPELFALGNY